MSRKSAAIADLVRKYRGKALPAQYLAYFDCFNRQLFYEAHDVLEELWLPSRKTFDGDFYKGLIQLAGAFVHLQKNRLGPAAALLKLARTNLAKYPGTYLGLSVLQVLGQTDDWMRRLESEARGQNPLAGAHAPRIEPPSAE